MYWNSDRSLKLSKICIYIFFVSGVLLCIFAPYLLNLLVEMRPDVLKGKLPLLYLSVYCLSLPAFLALYNLYRLLDNIDKQLVFTQGNVSILRSLSWLCILAGVISLVSSLYYLPFLIVGILAAFVGLILRVVKNVFCEAVQLKADNDFTI
ncbi:MAG: DUF2975 domain-containing protein [Oscillospiraceae bacterium]